MWIYVFRRLIYTVPILLGVLLITFLIFFSVTEPETLARMRIGEKAPVSQVYKWMIENDYAEYNESGLKKLKLLREGKAEANTAINKQDIDEHSKAHLFLIYVGDLVSFEFGKTNEKRKVSDVLASGIGPSLKLMIPAFILSEFLAVFFSLFAALYRNTKIDRSIVVGSVILMSISPVAMILFAQKLFAADWNYFPISGYASGIPGYAYLILPMLIYVASRMGQNTRFNRILMLDEVGQDYVRTAAS